MSSIDKESPREKHGETPQILTRVPDGFVAELTCAPDGTRGAGRVLVHAQTREASGRWRVVNAPTR